jgi:hypothetical protein
LLLDFETAWARLPALLQDIGLSIGSMDEATGLVAQTAERISRLDGKRMSAYLDCGSGTTAEPYANQYHVSLSYEVLIAPDQVGRVLNAEMRLEATATPRDVTGNPLRCRSKGTLEELVFERLQVGE